MTRHVLMVVLDISLSKCAVENKHVLGDVSIEPFLLRRSDALVVDSIAAVEDVIELKQ